MKTFTEKLLRAFCTLILFCSFNCSLNAQSDCIHFDGTDDRVVMSSHSFGSNWTAEAWINPDNVFPGNWSTVLSQAHWDGVTGFAIAVHNGSVFLTGPSGFILSTPITAGVWTHVAATYNNGIFAFYKNGVLVGTQAGTFANASRPFYIAARDNNDLVSFPVIRDHFQGKIDEVRIWNVTRSQCEIQRYMNCEIPGVFPGLAGNYHFSEGVPNGINFLVIIVVVINNNILTDYSGNNHDGTLTNFGLSLGGSTSNWTNLGPPAQGNTSPAAPSVAEVNVVGNGNSISDGATIPLLTNHTDFGSNASRTFTIQNTGGTTLNVGTPVITGPNAAQFSISVAPSTLLAASTGTTSFVVAFTPTSAGVKTATVHIYNSECTSEEVYDFVITGTPPTGETLTFDGLNDRVRVSDPVFGTSDLTIEAWVKPNVSSNGVLFTTRTSECCQPGNWWTLFHSNGSLYVELAEAGGGPTNYTAFATPNMITIGSWNHIAFVRSGLELYVYVNGILGARFTDNFVRNFNTGAGALDMGVWTYAGGAFWFNGSMDEVRLWTVARTQHEIQSFMNCEFTTTPANLVGNYHFTQASAGLVNTGYNTLTDASASVRTGNLFGFNLTGSSSNWTGPGGVATGSTTSNPPVVEIDVQGNSTFINDGAATALIGDHTNFNGAITRTFVVSNSVSGGTLNFAPYLTGTGAAHFSVTTFPAAAVNGIASASFVTTFTPLSTGVKTATLNLVNNDLSEPVYDFVITATPTTADALDFDGIDDYVETSTNVTELGQGDFTIETWIKTRTGSNDFGIVSCLDGDGIWEPGEKCFYTENDGSLHFVGFGCNYVHSTYPVNDNNWHHVAVVWDLQSGVTGIGRIYVDGIDRTSSSDFVANTANLGTFKVARHNNNESSQFFRGSMDELRIWNTARTQCEIQTFMNCEIPGPVANLLLNYHFNQGSPALINSSVSTLLDNTASPINGVLTAMTLSGTTSNWVSPGGVINNFTTAVVPTANFSLTGNGNNVPMGVSTTTLNNTDFSANAARTFSIYNAGGGTLNINTIIFTGPNAAQFSVTTLPASSLTTGGSSFVITLTPTNTGISTATVNVSSNDCTNPTFSFVITASTSPAEALAFNGSTSYVNLGNSSLDKPTSALSAEVWVYKTSWTAVNESYISNTQAAGYALWASNTGSIFAYVHRNGSYGIVSTPMAALTPGWHHLALTYSGRFTKLYVDGILKGTDDAGATYPIAYAGNSTLLGAEAFTGSTPEPGYYFNGKLDEVRIWNTERTQCEIQSYMNCEIPLSAPGLNANYHFNQGIPSGANPGVVFLNDDTGANNGVLNGFVLTGSVSNWVSPGALASGFTTAVVPTGVLNIYGNGNIVPIGVVTATINYTDFDVATNRTFLVHNPGAGTLYVNSFSLSGANAANFSVTSLPSSSLAGSANSPFIISFTPTALGTQSAILTISSSDCTNPTFSFVITASTSPASALVFDGINDRAIVASGISLDNKSFTVEFWAKRTGTANNIVVGQGGTISTNLALHIGFRGTPQNEFTFAFYANDINYTTTAATDLQYHHWACVYNKTITAGPNRFVYLDGILVASDRTNIDFLGTGPFVIGNAGFLSNEFEGSLDELRVWSVPRTQCEIQSYMNCEIPTTAPGLMANYHFNQGIPAGANASYSTALDAAGGNTAVFTGFSLTGATSNWNDPGGVISGSATPAVPGASILVSGNSNSITPGSILTTTLNHTDFGTASTRTFVIQNFNTGTLNVSAPYFTGPDASLFTVSALPSLSLGASATTSFVVAFTPTSLGFKTATLNINNNDCGVPIFNCVIGGTPAVASALNFDGTDDQVVIPHTTALDNVITGNFSFEAWVNPTANNFNTIISKGNGGYVINGGEYIFQLNASNQLAFFHTDLNGWKYSNGGVPLNAWSHVAVTYDGNHLKFYINGLLDATRTSSVNSNTAGNNPVFIGRQGFSCNCNFFQGSLDEVRVWTVPRTQCEIITYMNCEIPTTATGLLANYHMNHGIPSGANTSFTLVSDATGVNDGSVAAMSLSGNTSNWVSPGGVISGSTTPAVMGASLVISGNSNSITPGSATPSFTNFTNFGTNSTRTFVVTNPGTGTLHIGNGLFTGANASNFAITAVTSTLLGASASGTLVITFTPSSVSSHSAILTIYSSDCTAPEYSFVITASATPASALSFDGAGDRVNTIDINPAALPVMSFEAWVYRTGGTGIQTIIGNDDGGWDRGLMINNGAVHVWAGRDIVTGFTSGLNTWEHYMVSWSATEIKCIKNGTQVYSTTGESPSSSANNGGIGAVQAGWLFSFEGMIDEARIWNTARTQCEVLSYMDCEIPTTAPGLVANYHFNQGIPAGPNASYSIALDATGSNNGTMSGFSLNGAISNWVNPGGVVSNYTTASTQGASITVSGNGNNIPQGTATSTNNFTDFGAASTRTFVIHHAGTGTLYVNTAVLSGANATSFSITTFPVNSSITTTGTGSFVISFSPLALGIHSAIVTVNSSDCAAPDYSFVITATAVTASAIEFDGIDDYIDLGTSALLKPTAALTAEAWVYQANWPGSAVTFVGNAQFSGYTLRTNGTELRGFVYVNGGFLVASTPLATITPGWHHVASTYDGRYINLYMDGILKATNDAGAIYPVTYVGNNMVLGAEAGAGAVPIGGYMTGKLDEVRIWNRALCQAEIQNNMNCEISVTGNGLVANYHFNEGIAFGANPTVTTLPDLSGNILNGTLMDMAQSGAISNWVNPGAVPSGSSCTAFTAPEIGVYSGIIPIPDGYTVPTATNSTDFGNISTSGNSTRTYTIQNTGIAVLAISSITMSGAGATSFTVGPLVPASPIGIGGTAVFSVTFAPTSIGTKTAVVNISNGDCDESVYDFEVSGTATAGESFVFDGTNDYINCGTLLTSSYSKEAWVKIQASMNGNNFIDAGSGVSGTAFWCPGIYNYSLSAGHDGAWNLVQDNTPLSFGTWYHVAVTYDAPSKTMILYKNGVQVSINTNVSPFTGTHPLHIGAYAGVFTMNGSMDEVRIWNRPLCPAEIVNNMNCEIPTTAPGLIANYHFNQGVGYGANPTTSLVTDVAGSAHTGTVMSSVLSGSLSNWQTGSAVTTGSSCPVITIPEINLVGNAASITDGATLSVLANHTDFGAICINTVMVRTYTIQNSGTANLTVSGITMSGANAAMFTVGALSPASPIAPGGTAVFSVTFTPTSAGTKSAAVNIANNDCNEAPYDFVLTGTCNALPVVAANTTNSVICNGFSTTLNGGGATTYTWVGGTPAVTNAVAFSPTTTLTYTVSGTDALTGCTSTNLAVQTITVNPTPTITASSNSLVLCNGNSATITAGGAGIGGIYTLSPGPITITGNTIVVSPALTQTYGVTGTSSNVCVGLNTVVITITVNPLPAVTATASKPVICNTATTSLIGGGADTYTWTGITPPVSNGAAFSPSVTLTYTVSGTYALTGCTSTNLAVQTITVDPIPTVSAGAINSVICNGATATLTASGADTYTWNPGPLTGSLVTPATTTLTTYTVVGTSSAGCTSTNLAVQTISVNSLPSVTAAISSSAVCAGNTIIVNGSGADTYTWDAGVSDGITFVPSASGSYSVTGTNTLTGCTSTNVATVSVAVNALPSLSVTITNAVICLGGQSTLSGSGASTYTWTDAIKDNVAFSPTLTTTYTLTATDLNTCTNTAVATITVNSLPVLSVAGTPTLSCEGESTTLTALGALSYSWSTSEVTTAIVITPTSTTVFTITATDINTCTNTLIYTQSVSPCPGSFTAQALSRNVTCRGKDDGSIRIIATSSYTDPVVSYIWSPATLCPNNDCDSLKNLKAGTYNVMVKITYTVNGILVKMDSLALDPIVLTDLNGDCEIKVFSGVTLNNDGVNDMLQIENIEEYPNNKVMVFNRWGQEVYSVSGYDNKEKGWPKKGEANNLSSNTYFYIVDPGNGAKPIKGWIELIKE